ncbi:MAG: hypothetical protein K6U74_16930 [Firmicutes bacterium]|nr:hypothetical protein [Bacillota bacterium]
MYCRNCGQEINENAEICTSCGVRPLMERNFCQECGVETKNNQELCVKCGVRLKCVQVSTEDGKPIYTDFSALDPYYQEEFTKILNSNEVYKGKWNWAAFFFGGIWALVKGVWLAALISFVAIPITGFLLAFVYPFIFGARGNYMYYCRYVKRKQLII